MKTAAHTPATGLAVCVLFASLYGCSKESTGPVTPAPSRTYRMGFSGIPPRADFDLAIRSLDMWSMRADAAIISKELPWDSLLAGITPQVLIGRDELGLANYFQARGLQIWVDLDPANGLNRAGEADALVRAGRSISEPAVQAMFRRYVIVLDSLLAPEHVGLALETNLHPARPLPPPSMRLCAQSRTARRRISAHWDPGRS